MIVNRQENEMSNKEIELGMEVHHNEHGSKIFNVVEITRGWVTIEDEDGEQLKARGANLTEVEYEEDGAVRLKPDHSRYIRGLGETASGRSTYDIDDFVAREMRSVSKDQDAQYELAANYLSEEDGTKTQEEFKAELEARYAKLNMGMVRMNLGNKIRGVLNRKAKAAEEMDATMTQADSPDVEVPLAMAA